MSRKQKASPIVKNTMDNSDKLQILASKLTKTLEDTRNLRDNLRAARNELGEARDGATRANADTAELRNELRRAGAARAEAVLEPLVAHIHTMQPHILAVTAALEEYRNSLDWKNWQPQRAGTELYTSLKPVYHQLGITESSNKPAYNAPSEIKAILTAVAGRFASALPDTLEQSLEYLNRHLLTLSETVRASLRAVERVPGMAGGRRRHITRRRVQ
jgi:chromosome segregation ATPase